MSSSLKQRIREAAGLPARETECIPCRAERNARAEEFTGRIVVVLPSRNEATPAAEGNKLLATVEASRSSKAPKTLLEFAVIDDASEDNCAQPLRDAPDVHLYRHAQPRGQGVNRNLGVWLHPGARGYVEMDAHLEINRYGLETLVLDAEETGGFVGCLSGNLNKRSDRTRRGGCRWNIVGSGEDLDLGCLRRKGYGITWIYAKKDAPRLMPVPIQRGACCAFTEATFRRFGGYSESYGFYGFADHDLAIRAYFLGIPSHVNTMVWARHWYRVLRPYPMAGQWTWWGYIESLRMMFRPETWRRVFEPAARKAARLNRDPMMEYLMRTPRFDAIQAAFEQCKQRTDEQTLEWMGIGAERA